MLLKVFRGVERIRTAVVGFADPSLATRPRHHKRKYKKTIQFSLYKLIFFAFQSF